MKKTLLLVASFLIATPSPAASLYEAGISGYYERFVLSETAGTPSTASPYFAQFVQSQRESFGAALHFYRAFALTKDITFKTGPSFHYGIHRLHDSFPDDFDAKGSDSIGGGFDFKFTFDSYAIAAPFLIAGAGVNRLRSEWTIASLNANYTEELYGFLLFAGGGIEYKHSPVIRVFLSCVYTQRALSPSVEGVNDVYVQDGGNLAGGGWRLETGVNFNL